MRQLQDDSQQLLIKKNELKKHVAIIHSSNKITLLQRKIANALLWNAYPGLDINDEHTIHIGYLCHIIGYRSHDHRTIKNALVNLLSTVIEWNLVEDKTFEEESVWNASAIIADASIDGAVCTYSYSNRMRELLYKPNMYGRIDMAVQAKFQSTYGLALYENCNRYQDIKQTPWFEMEKFRKLMGVDAGKYKIFRDFKNRVIDKAIEEVNKYSNIYVEVKFKKVSRQVVALQFKITNNLQTEYEEVQSEENDLEDKLKLKYNLSTKQISSLCHQYDDAFIKAKMDLVENSNSFLKGKIKHLGLYLISALKGDYQTTKILEPPKPKFIPSTLPSPKQAEYERFCDKEMLGFFDKYTHQTQKKILSEFKTYLNNTVYRHLYQNEGLKNILVRDQLAKFLKLSKKNLLKKIISYEKWLEQN